MKRVGAHVSAAGCVQQAPLNAAEIGAKALAMLTKNQKQWQAAPLTREQIARLKENCHRNGYAPAQILPHDSYLINLGNPEPESLKKSRAAFIDEMRRCEILGLAFLNFHSGNNKNLIGENECLDLIAESINLALEATRGVTAAWRIPQASAVRSATGSNISPI